MSTELIAIDLLSAAWLPFQLPYLRALHTSPISACTHVANVNASVVDMLTRAHNTETATKYSQRAWPIQGGFVVGKTVDNDCQQLLITGFVFNVQPVCTMNVQARRRLCPHLVVRRCVHATRVRVTVGTIV